MSAYVYMHNVYWLSITKVDSLMQICGEHKESGILRHGYLASPFFKDTGLTEVEEKCGGRCELGLTWRTLSNFK